MNFCEVEVFALGMTLRIVITFLACVTNQCTGLPAAIDLSATTVAPIVAPWRIG